MLLPAATVANAFARTDFYTQVASTPWHRSTNSVKYEDLTAYVVRVDRFGERKNLQSGNATVMWQKLPCLLLLVAYHAYVI